MNEKKLEIPGWKIVRTIDQGGFGTVYEVEKDDEFGGVAHSALKVISIPAPDESLEDYRKEGYDDEALAALFRKRIQEFTDEYRLMSLLKGCSNIVSYEDHEIVRHTDDPGYDVYIRMELLTPLPTYLDYRFGNLYADEATVRKLGIDICSALQRCSRHSIIHRDIKPQNIFINDDGDFKLGDFGVAKIADRVHHSSKVGTYSYMSPEVYHGQPYQAQVDLYSLGMVLYWMLNERRGPFLPLPPAAIAPEKVEQALERRMHGELLPPPKYGSPNLKRIVLKACAFDSGRRYSDAAAMKADLEQLQIEPEGSAPVPDGTTRSMRAAGFAPADPMALSTVRKPKDASRTGREAQQTSPTNSSLKKSAEIEPSKSGGFGSVPAPDGSQNG